MTTIEGNKIIVKFDGFKFYNDDPITYPIGYYIGEFKGERIIKQEDEFEYHSFWDWLMPIVEKIESMNELVSIEQKSCIIINDKDPDLHNWFMNPIETKTKIEAVWFAVIDFIQWYNQNK